MRTLGKGDQRRRQPLTDLDLITCEPLGLTERLSLARRKGCREAPIVSISLRSWFRYVPLTGGIERGRSAAQPLVADPGRRETTNNVGWGTGKSAARQSQAIRAENAGEQFVSF